MLQHEPTLQAEMKSLIDWQDNVSSYQPTELQPSRCPPRRSGEMTNINAVISPISCDTRVCTANDEAVYTGKDPEGLTCACRGLSSVSCRLYTVLSAPRKENI